MYPEKIVLTLVEDVVLIRDSPFIEQLIELPLVDRDLGSRPLDK